MTDTLDTLRQAILLDPADDLVRHAYADALEEAGLDAYSLRWMLANPEEEVTVQTCDSTGSPFSNPLFVWSAGANGVCDALRHDLPDLPFRECVCRRGFVEWLVCTAGAWLEHGPDVVRQHPVAAVTLLDLLPDLMAMGAVHGRGEDGLCRVWSEDNVPPEVFDRLSGRRAGRYAVYASYSDAVTDLDRAAVRWAREEAGLPPLHF